MDKNKLTANWFFIAVLLMSMAVTQNSFAAKLVYVQKFVGFCRYYYNTQILVGEGVLSWLTTPYPLKDKEQVELLMKWHGVVIKQTFLPESENYSLSCNLPNRTSMGAFYVHCWASLQTGRFILGGMERRPINNQRYYGVLGICEYQ